MTYVSLEFVKKMMSKYGRVIVYVKDQEGILWSNEDESAPLPDVQQELENAIAESSGNFVTIELPARAKGQGKKGGNKFKESEQKFIYRVKLNNNNNGNGGQSFGGLPLIMSLMEKNNALSLQMINQQHENSLKEIQKELKEMKEGKSNSPIEKFAEVCFDKYTEGKRAEKAFKKATAGKPEATAEAPINDEVKHNKKTVQVKEALDKLKEVDADYLDNLSFMAEYAQQNPTIYKEFIANLKNPE